MLRAISRGSVGAATALLLVLGISACGGRRPSAPDAAAVPAVPRVLPLARVFVLETSGPSPSDTSVTFTTGTSRVIVLRHGPPENVVFAELGFEPAAFGDSGRSVRVDLRPRPGVYGLDVVTSLPLQANQARVTFKYARYFSAPARARQVYGSDVAFERALAVGRLLADGQVELFPPTSAVPDHLGAVLPLPGSYIVAAPQ